MASLRADTLAAMPIASPAPLAKIANSRRVSPEFAGPVLSSARSNIQSLYTPKSFAGRDCGAKLYC
jgi:hypothetical protein